MIIIILSLKIYSEEETEKKNFGKKQKQKIMKQNNQYRKPEYQNLMNHQTFKE